MRTRTAPFLLASEKASSQTCTGERTPFLLATMLQLNPLEFPSKQSLTKALEFDCLQAPDMSARTSQRTGRRASRLSVDSSQGSPEFDLSGRPLSSSSRPGSSTRSGRSGRETILSGREGVGGSKKASKWSQYSVVVAQMPIQVEIYCGQNLPHTITITVTTSYVAAPGTFDRRRRSFCH